MAKKTTPAVQSEPVKEEKESLVYCHVGLDVKTDAEVGRHKIDLKLQKVKLRKEVIVARVTKRFYQIKSIHESKEFSNSEILSKIQKIIDAPYE